MNAMVKASFPTPVKASMEDVMGVLDRNRFSIPPHVLAAMRQLAEAGITNLSDNFSPENFKKLSLKEQLDLLAFIMDRTYGKPDSAITAAAAAYRYPEGGDGLDASDQGSQLDAIEARAAARGQSLPEMKHRGGAAKAVPATKPVASHGGNSGERGEVVDLPSYAILSNSQRSTRRAG